MKLALSLLMLPVAVLAHPISQGSIDVEVTPGNLHVRARVPVEAVFLTGHATTLAETWREHGQYFLQHFQIAADGRDLAGTLTGVTEPVNERVIYDFDFPLANAPTRLQLRQNLLNEISYAPGNAWEATFVVSVGGKGLGLLTSKGPLAIAGEEHDRTRMFGEYLRHGITHILSGYDHLLFIAALALAALTVWDLIKVVGMFTLAHSVTLTLSVFNIVRLPSSVVEPMIAASIVFVALSNVFWPQRSRGRVRLATAFFFGLFHGLGFAGGLLGAMSGLAGISVGLAILAFSLGVELGHQLVVLPVFWGLRVARAIPPTVSLRYGSAFISVAGMFYLIAALR
jgi:hypothetical protein